MLQSNQLIKLIKRTKFYLLGLNSYLKAGTPP